MYLYKHFTLKHLKSLRHVSILRSSSGSYVVPCGEQRSSLRMILGSKHVGAILSVLCEILCKCICWLIIKVTHFNVITYHFFRETSDGAGCCLTSKLVSGLKLDLSVTQRSGKEKRHQYNKKARKWKQIKKGGGKYQHGKGKEKIWDKKRGKNTTEKRVKEERKWKENKVKKKRSYESKIPHLSSIK